MMKVSGRMGAWALVGVLATVAIGCGDSATPGDGGVKADATADATSVDAGSADGPSADATAPDSGNADTIQLWVGFGELCGPVTKSSHVVRCLDSRLCVFTGQGRGYCTEPCKQQDEGKACSGGKSGESFVCALSDKLNSIYACLYVCKRKPAGGGNEETFTCPGSQQCGFFSQKAGNGDEITLCAP